MPTFYSGCLFLINALLLLIIWQAGRTRSKPKGIWLLLAALFIFLAYDELFSVHELLIKSIREAWNLSGVLFFAWVLPYGLGVLLVTALFAPVWWRMNKTVRLWCGLSAASYLSGTIVFEMIGAKYYQAIGHQRDVVFRMLATIEESLEITGLIMFTYSLLLLLQIEYGGLAIEIPGNKKGVPTNRASGGKEPRR